MITADVFNHFINKWQIRMYHCSADTTRTLDYSNDNKVCLTGCFLGAVSALEKPRRFYLFWPITDTSNLSPGLKTPPAGGRRAGR